LVEDARSEHQPKEGQGGSVETNDEEVTEKARRQREVEEIVQPGQGKET
jgi:hypothetical protein